MSDKTPKRNPWRPSLFWPKDGDRLQGVITVQGSSDVETVRDALAVKHGQKTVSDGDLIEYLARFAVAHLGKLMKWRL